MLNITKKALYDETVGRNSKLIKITKDEPEDFMFEADLFIKGSFYKKVRRRCKTKEDFVKEIRKDYKKVLE